MDEFVNLIDYYILEKFEEEAPESLTERKIAVSGQIARLRQIYTSLEDEKLIQKKILTTRSLLYNILKNEGNSLITEALQDAKIRNRIGKLIFEAYELTSMILVNIGLIDPIHFTFTYASKKGNVFYRSEKMQIDPNKDLKFELRNNQQTLVIRLKTSVIRQKLLENQLGKEDGGIIVAKHYKKFIEPFLENEKKGSWKMNVGVATEAFERHWEQLKHSLTPPNMNDADLGSVGSRWVLYKMSSGSDPYYTGPDTAESQVKNANASIISNADTVINTIQAVLKLADTNLDITAIQQIAAQYKLAFQQKQASIDNILKGLENIVDEDILQEAKEAIAANPNLIK